MYKVRYIVYIAILTVGELTFRVHQAIALVSGSVFPSLNAGRWKGNKELTHISVSSFT